MSNTYELFRDILKSSYPINYATLNLNTSYLDTLIEDFRSRSYSIAEKDIMEMAYRSFWYKKANVQRFRSIIRKAKQDATTI